MPYKPRRYWSCHAGASQQGASTVIPPHSMLELMLCANSPSESRLLTLKKKENKIVFICLTGKKTLKLAGLVGNEPGGSPAEPVNKVSGFRFCI